MPQPTQQEIQQYYSDHVTEYSVPEQARSRHILISVPEGADAKTDAAAKAKAERFSSSSRRAEAGPTWRRKTPTIPAARTPAANWVSPQRGKMVPAFDNAIFTQKIGDIEIVKSNFGYHIVQVEERQPAHTQPLNEVLPTIQATLRSPELGSGAGETMRRQLTSEAIKNGLEKTAAAHHLQLVTTQPVAQRRRDCGAA